MGSSAGREHPWWQRALAVALSASLAVSGVPVAAWAESAAGPTVPDTQAQQQEDPASGDGASGGSAADGSAADQDTSGEGQSQGDAASQDGGDAKNESLPADADPSGDGGSSEASGASGGASARRAPAADSLGQEGIAPTAVQMQRGGSEVTSQTGLSLGDVLTAVPGTFEDDDWGYGEEFEPLPDASGCSYQWYRGSGSVDYASGASSFSDRGYEPIAGATSATYTVRDDDAGQCLAVKVTYDGSDVWPGSSTGSVRAAGSVTLGSVELAGTPSVGSTLTATAYAGSRWDRQPLPEGTNVTYTWRWSDEEPSYYGTSWTTIDGVSGSTLELTDAYVGKYLSVTANAGDNTVELSSYSAVGPVLGEGQARLYSVELDSTRPSVGDTLTATAKKSYSSPVDAGTKVTYAWYVDGTQVQSGESGQLVVTPDMAGKVIRVEASAGVNTQSASTSKVRLQGQVDIDTATLDTYRVAAGSTVTARARERGASGFVDPSRLTYQWQISRTDTADASFADIPGATSQSLALDDTYVGAHVRCVITPKVGDAKTTRATMAVAAAGSVYVSSVAVEPSGKVQTGTTLKARALSGSTDVTASQRVAWSWYWATSDSSGAQWHRIEGEAVGGENGSTLQVTALLRGYYLKAVANGGYEDASQVVGPVVEAGAVELHHVTVTGTARVGETLSATPYVLDDSSYYTRYVEAAGTAPVSYQWQYASTASTDDDAFANIPGETGRTLRIGETNGGVSLAGKYLRVVATSDGSVASTQQPSRYGTGLTSAVPAGPVAAAGQYTLSSVAVSSSAQGAQVGATLTPQARVEDGYLEANVPGDAKTTYTWETSPDGDSGWTQVAGNPDRSLTLGDALRGSYVRVSASALDNTVRSASYRVVGAGEYDLLRVTTSPQINSSTTRLFTGDAVQASVQAKGMTGSTSFGDTVTDRVAVQWYVADTDQGPWSVLEGATSAQLQVPQEAGGKYLKCVATSGDSSVELASASPVIDASSLSGALAKLDATGWRPDPTYGEDTNVNDVLAEKLRGMGLDDVSVTTTAAEHTYGGTPASARVGISSGDADNGTVTYFYMDPDSYTGWSANYTGWRQMDVTFRVSAGDETVDGWSPSKPVTVDFDLAAYRDMLEQKVGTLSVGYADGDSADSVTRDVTLPGRLKGADGASLTWSSVSWKSGGEAISVPAYGSYDLTGSVSRGLHDQEVTLTATVGLSSYGLPEVAVDKTFDVTVKADPDKVSAARADLASKLDAGFTLQGITRFGTGEAIDPRAVAYDLQMPRTRELGVDGKYYDVAFSCSDPSTISFNGYHGIVVRPLNADEDVQVTCTVTDKSNPEIAASKTLSLTVGKIDAADVDGELALLERVEAGYKAALLDGQGEPAGGNLSTFQKAYVGDDGTLVFARSEAEASGHVGIVPTELPGYDDMGPYDQARLFKSSDKAVVLNESLQLAWNADRSTSLSQYHDQPTYNTRVTIGSRLRSERLGGYYDRYKDDPSVPQDLKDKLARLAGEDVSADITIAGTSGKDDPKGGNPGDDPSRQEKVRATVSLVRVNDDGSQESWLADADSGELPAGSTVADATKAALDGSGISYDPSLLTFTRGGQSLGWNEKTGQYWNLYVNGRYAQTLPSSLELSSGDVITWIYKGERQEISVNDVKVDPAKVRPRDITAEWPAYRNGGNQTSAPTPTSQTGTAWVRQVYERKGSGDMSGVSEPILVGGRVFIAVGDTLQMRDSSSGEVLRSARLAASIDSTCRMTYTNGIIVVPLHSGMLQALTPDDLTTVWVAPSAEGTAADSSQQALSTLTVSGEYVYAGTSDGGKTSGYLRCVRLSDGRVMWTRKAQGTGYYWSGAAVTSHGVLVAQNSGRLKLLSAEGSNGQGRVLASVDLGSEVSSTVVTPADDAAFVMGRDGTLYRVSVGDGSLAVSAKRKLCGYSISTPTVVGGKVYVGGSAPGGMTGGALFVLDASTLGVEHVVTGFSDGSALAGNVAASPLVASRGGSTYVYFTANDGIGGVYLYRVGDATAGYLYVPREGERQYTLSSLAADSAGALYYVNDSGRLFKVGGTDAGGEVPDGRKDPGKKGGAPGGSAGCSGGGGAGGRSDPTGPVSGGTGEGDDSGRGSNDGGGSGGDGSSSGNASRGSGLRRRSAGYLGGTGSWQGSGTALRPLWLLSNEGSDELGSGDEALPAEPSQDGEATPEEGQEPGRRGLPVWPIIGMVAGAAVLVAALVWRRRRGEE